MIIIHDTKHAYRKYGIYSIHTFIENKKYALRVNVNYILKVENHSTYVFDSDCNTRRFSWDKDIYYTQNKEFLINYVKPNFGEKYFYFKSFKEIYLYGKNITNS